MESIINAGIYDETKTFIQKYIQSSVLTKETQDMFIFLYNTLTPDNALEVYKKVSSLYQQDVMNMKWELSMSIWKYSSIGFITGGIVNLAAYIGLRYYPTDPDLKTLEIGSTAIMFLSGIVFMAGGFS